MCGCLLEQWRAGKGAVAQVGEAEPGPMGAETGERSAVVRRNLTECDDFPMEQSQGETLKNTFDQVRSIDGQPLQPTQLLSYPYFAILKDRLYRVTQDTQSKQDATQLLVPKSRPEMLFQPAHCNPMAGHLGQTATLNRLMTRFFWPGIHENVRRWCTSCRVCQKPAGHPKSTIVLAPSYAGPLRTNWHGPHQAIRTICTWASLCISLSGLCNTIPRGSGTPQHFREKCGGRIVSSNLPGGNPERDSHRSRHRLSVNFMNYWALNRFAPASTTHKQTVWSNVLIAH